MSRPFTTPPTPGRHHRHAGHTTAWGLARRAAEWSRPRAADAARGRPAGLGGSPQACSCGRAGVGRPRSCEPSGSAPAGVQALRGQACASARSGGVPPVVLALEAGSPGRSLGAALIADPGRRSVLPSLAPLPDRLLSLCRGRRAHRPVVRAAVGARRRRRPWADPSTWALAISSRLLPRRSRCSRRAAAGGFGLPRWLAPLRLPGSRGCLSPARRGVRPVSSLLGVPSSRWSPCTAFPRLPFFTVSWSVGLADD